MNSNRRNFTRTLIAAAALSSVSMAWAADTVKIGYTTGIHFAQ